MSLTRFRVCCAALLVFGFGCEQQPAARAFSPAPEPSQALDRKALAVAATSTAPTSSALPKSDVQELEFGESERSRDPFRSYEQTFLEESRAVTKSQRQVVLPDRGIDELKLIGVVTGVADAKAMLVDPTGKGYVVQRGQFIGHAEVVHGDGQGAPAYEVNWRVDRIRDGDIVLVREDPKHPEIPTATRVIPLRTDAKTPVESLEPH